MTDVFTYRNYLEREFDGRCRRNSRYSMRAFARDIGIQASKLSEILKKQCGLSSEAAFSIAQKLRLSDIEARHFVTLVEAEHSRSRVRRKQALQLLESFQRDHKFNELDLERFKIISDWFHFALLELTDVSDFSSDPQWISRRLNVPLQKIENAIERLLEFGLLQQDRAGRLKQTHIDLATPSGIPSREIREHHAQILAKAMESIDHFSVHERDLSSTTMAIDASQLDEAKKVIKEFRREFSKRFQSKESKNRVYCLSTQFFPLDVTDRDEGSIK